VGGGAVGVVAGRHLGGGGGWGVFAAIAFVYWRFAIYGTLSV